MFLKMLYFQCDLSKVTVHHIVTVHPAVNIYLTYGAEMEIVRRSVTSACDAVLYTRHGVQLQWHEQVLVT